MGTSLLSMLFDDYVSQGTRVMQQSLTAMAATLQPDGYTTTYKNMCGQPSRRRTTTLQA
jgi:hypothetical protein